MKQTSISNRPKYVIFTWTSTDGQGTKWRRNIAENFNRLSRMHERYRQTDDKWTDGRHSERDNVSSRSLKTFKKNL